MSSGKLHQDMTVTLIAPVFVASWAITGDVVTSAVVASGCSFTIICGPDLDIDHVTQNEVVLLRLFRPLGWVWIGLWYPYAKAIPHRSPLSHWPIVGTALRDGYLYAILYSIAWLFGLETAVSSFIGDYAYFIIAFIVGQICADTVHFLADIVSTRIKRF